MPVKYVTSTSGLMSDARWNCDRLTLAEPTLEEIRTTCLNPC